MVRTSVESARSPATFSVLWSAADCERFKARYPNAAPQTRVMLGGWNRQTGFVRAGIRPGDTVVAVHVARKRLYLLTWMIVTEIDADGVTETVRGTFGSRVHFDLAVPPGVLERWRFAGGRRERPVKFLDGGEITRSNSFQGVYRLSPQTATELFGLMLEHEARYDSIGPR